MNELAQVEQDIEHGHVSAGSLVQLFNVASEARTATRPRSAHTRLHGRPAARRSPRQRIGSRRAPATRPLQRAAQRRSGRRSGGRARPRSSDLSRLRTRTRGQPRSLPRLRRASHLEAVAGRERLLVLDILESYVRERDAQVRIVRETGQQWHCRLWPCPGNLITGVGRTAREAIRNAREQAGVEIPR